MGTVFLALNSSSENKIYQYHPKTTQKQIENFSRVTQFCLTLYFDCIFYKQN